MKLLPHKKLAELFSKIRKHRIHVFAVAILTIGLLIFGQVFAATGVPQIINFQGRLLDSSANLLGGSSGTNYCFRFSLYDAATSGTKLWPASTPSTMTLPVRQGVFDANIGDTSAGGDVLNYDFQSNNSVYVNVEVAAQVSGSCSGVTFETLTPRQQVVSSGYAINSGTVGGFAAAQSASGNQIPALTSDALVLGGASAAVRATSTTALTLQGGGATGDLQFFSSSNKITSSGALTLAGGITAATFNGNTFTTGTGTLTIAAGKTLTSSNTLTLAGTDGSTLNVGTGGTLGSAAYTATSAYQAPITLTTTGTSGAATFTSNTLNIPQYASGVTSVSNSDGSITISPTTGAVVASLNLAKANVFTAAQTVNETSLGTTPTDGLTIENTTAAANNAQQISPSIHWDGQGWGTTAGTSQDISFIANVLPSQSTVPIGIWQLQAAVAGGAYSNVLSVTSRGAMTVAGGVTAAGFTTSSGINANISIFNATGSANTSTAGTIFAGASSVAARSLFFGASSTIPANESYGAVVVASAPLATAATGTHTLLANEVINAIGSVSPGGATITNTASLYIDGASTAGTNNYAIDVGSGLTALQGGLTVTGTTTLDSGLTGILKASSGVVSAAIGDTDYQKPITLTTTGSSGAATFTGDTLNIPQYAGATYTAGTGLTLTSGAFSVNTSQNISTLSNLTSNGIVTTSGGTGVLSVTATTGSGNVVLATSPTLVTPTLGAATTTTINGLSLTSNTTGFAVAGGTTSKILTVSNTLTLAGTDGSTLNIGAGGTLGSNAFTSTAYAPLASPTFTGTVTIPTPFTLGATSVTSTGTQLNLLNAATGTTGTASTNLVFSTSPTLVTPTLGAATATSINKVTITAPTTSATLTLITGSTLATAGAFSTTLTATGTTNVTLPTSGTLYGTATGSITSAQLATSLTNETGSGAAVFGTSPTITGGTLTTTSVNGVTLTTGGGTTTFLNANGTYTTPAGGGAVSSVSNADGSLTISPTTGAVVASLNLANPNIFTAEQQITNTTGPQFQINYDGTHNGTLSVSSAGVVTLDDSSGLVILGETTQVSGALYTSFSKTQGNFFVTNSIGATTGTTSQYQFAGSSTNFFRTGFYGSVSTTLSTGANYSSVIFGAAPITTFTSGTHPWLANVVVTPLGTVTSGGATVTNTASLYIDGAGAGGTNNYAVYTASGPSEFNGAFIITGTTTLATSLGGILKATSGVVSTATGDTDYQNPITLTTTGTSGAATFSGDTLNIPQYAGGGTTYTFSTGLTNTSGTVTVNTSQNISTLSNLTSNGLIKTSGSTGALSIATADTDYTTPTGTETISNKTISGSSNTLSNIANVSLANSTISGVALGSNLSNLSATNGTLTFSSSYNGSAAQTVGLNLANSNIWTADQTISGATLAISGNQSATAWTTLGTELSIPAATLTDSSSSGTVAVNAANAFGIPVLATTTNTVTDTVGATLYIAGAPTAGAHTTITTPYALYVASGNIFVSGAVVTGGITASGAFAGGIVSNNLWVPSATNTTTTTNASYLFAGATTVNIRTGLGGGTNNTAIAANDSFGGITVPNELVTTTTSGTNALLAGMVINPLTVSKGTGSTITNTATLYINGSASATVSGANYALWVASGLSQFGSASISGAVAVFQNSAGTCTMTPAGTGGLTCSSDMNLKKNITNLADDSSWSFNNNITPDNQSVMAKVLALNPVDYNWNVEQDTDPKHAGFIAQEVQQLFPDLVTEDSSTHLLSLNYTGLVPYTIEAIKEMNLNITTISDTTTTNTWRDALLAWLGSATNGIHTIFSDKITTNQLCVGSVCVTQSQFLQMVSSSAQSSSGAQQNNSTPPVTTTPSSPDPDPTPNPTTTQSSDTGDNSPIDTTAPTVDDSTVAPALDTSLPPDTDDTVPDTSSLSDTSGQ